MKPNPNPVATAGEIEDQLTDFYAETDTELRPDAQRITQMSEELADAGLNFESTSPDQLNRLARGESL